jgi:ADP-heptose:LPS heptosyltransferase
MTAETAIKSILVYCGSAADDAIGENILKLPLLRAIREAYPSAHLTWISGYGPCYFQGILKPLIEGMIDECLTDVRIEKTVQALLFQWKPLGDRRFDLIIDAQRHSILTVVLRRTPHRVFVSGSWRYFFSERRPPEPLVRPALLTDKLLGLVAAATERVIRPDHVWPLAQKLHDAARQILPGGPRYLGLAPGAGQRRTGKCWPLDRYIRLAQASLHDGMTPVFFLGPQETDWVEQVQSSVPDAVCPGWGRQDIPEDIKGPAFAMALGHRLEVAVANCSGIGHILAASGAPMVSLFGPTDPSKYAPYTPDLLALRAQDFGSSAAIESIPFEAVRTAVAELSARCAPKRHREQPRLDAQAS